MPCGAAELFVPVGRLHRRPRELRRLDAADARQRLALQDRPPSAPAARPRRCGCRRARPSPRAADPARRTRGGCAPIRGPARRPCDCDGSARSACATGPPATTRETEAEHRQKANVRIVRPPEAGKVARSPALSPTMRRPFERPPSSRSSSLVCPTLSTSTPLLPLPPKPPARTILTAAESAAAARARSAGAAFGPDHPDLAPTLNNLAMMLERQGDAAEAERCYRRAYDVVRRVAGPDDPRVQVTRANLIAFLQAWGVAEPVVDVPDDGRPAAGLPSTPSPIAEASPSAAPPAIATAPPRPRREPPQSKSPRRARRRRQDERPRKPRLRWRRRARSATGESRWRLPPERRPPSWPVGCRSHGSRRASLASLERRRRYRRRSPPSRHSPRRDRTRRRVPPQEPQSHHRCRSRRKPSRHQAPPSRQARPLAPALATRPRRRSPDGKAKARGPA